MNSSRPQTWMEPFNQREIEILNLISDGLSNREISQRMHLAPETIKWYNKQIFSKLGAGNRTQAVKIAGEHRLLDLPAPLLPEGELRPQSNLPAQLTSFVGRAKAVEEIRQLLKTSRLVVLTGPGGCGKSRLALQVAASLVGSYRHGVWLVELASISDPTLVVNSIIPVLKVNASSDAPLIDILKRFLRPRHLLLLLDNLEHLPEATAMVGDLLAAAPQLSVLATSRERLHVYGEQQYPVQPLDLPDLRRKLSPEELLACDSVNLFVQRARAAQPGFKANGKQLIAAAKICRRLDGLPLAIELAASQVKTYPPGLLVGRLDEGLDALPSGPRDLPPRQQTLRATLEWSHQLLGEGEKILFARLAVFSGGARLEGIEQVCSHGIQGVVMELLNALVEKNLLVIRQEQDGELRFTMLETIYRYAQERLDASGDAEEVRRRHAEYYTRLAEDAEREIRGARQTYWFARLRAELDNLRSIFSWSFNGGQVEYGLRLTASLLDYWVNNAMGNEGHRWAELALEKSGDASVALRARVLCSAGHLATMIQDPARGIELTQQAVDLFRVLKDERSTAWSLAFLSGNYLDQYQPEEASRIGMEALEIFRQLDDKPGLAYTFNLLGEIARLQGDYAAARCYYEESLLLVRETGEPQRESTLINNLCFVACHTGDYQQGLEYSLRSLQLARELDSEFRQACFLATLAGPTAALGQPERAARLLGASHALFEALGSRHYPVDQRELDLYEASARDQLGEEAFQAAWQEGQALTLQQAVAYALEYMGDNR